jgi:hypothetical protein
VHGTFDDCGVRNTEAVAWYRETLGKVDGRERNAVVLSIGETLDAKGVAGLITEQYEGTEDDPSYRLFRCIDDIELPAPMLASNNESISGGAASQVVRLCTEQDEDEDLPIEQHWPRLLELSREYADVFAHHRLYYRDVRELERWRLLWQQASRADSRQELAEAFLRVIDDEGEHQADTDIAAELMADDEGPFRTGPQNVAMKTRVG